MHDLSLANAAVLIITSKETKALFCSLCKKPSFSLYGPVSILSPLVNNSFAATPFTFLEIPVNLRWPKRGTWILCPGKNTVEPFIYSVSVLDSSLGCTQVSICGIQCKIHICLAGSNPISQILKEDCLKNKTIPSAWRPCVVLCGLSLALCCLLHLQCRFWMR